jgi:hypothetical protein
MPVANVSGADQRLDDCEMSDTESFPIGFHPRTRNVPTFTSPVDASVEDEMASSDDGDGEGDGDGNDDDDEIHPQPSDTQVVDKGHINPQVSIRVHKVRPDEVQFIAVH